METLAILFIVLKLIGVLAWSWLWVLSPIWIMFSIYLALGVCYGLFVLYIGYTKTGETKQ